MKIISYILTLLSWITFYQHLLFIQSSIMKPVHFPGLDGLKAFIRPLSVADVDSCVVVESAFPVPERCSKEKAYQKMVLLYISRYFEPTKISSIIV